MTAFNNKCNRALLGIPFAHSKDVLATFSKAGEKRKIEMFLEQSLK